MISESVIKPELIQFWIETSNRTRASIDRDFKNLYTFYRNRKQTTTAPLSFPCLRKKSLNQRQKTIAIPQKNLDPPFTRLPLHYIRLNKGRGYKGISGEGDRRDRRGRRSEESRDEIPISISSSSPSARGTLEILFCAAPTRRKTVCVYRCRVDKLLCLHANVSIYRNII